MAAVLSLLIWTTVLDEVHLKEGGILVGRVEERSDEVRITRDGNTVVLPRYLVKKIVYAPLPEDLYEEKKGALPEGNVDARLELARWCKAVKLEKQAEEQFRDILRIEPDHLEARKALGYVRMDDGRWATEDDLMAAKGLVRHEGQWITPEERDARVQAKAEEGRLKEVRRGIRRALLDIAGSSEKRRAAALQVLAAIPWSDKLDLFLDALTGDTTPVRRFAAGELGDSADPRAVPKLVRAWLGDADAEVRAAAKLSLSRINAPETVFPLLIKALYTDRNDVRENALRALRDSPDERALPFLLYLWEHNLAELAVEFSQAKGSKEAIFERVIELPDGAKAQIPRRAPPRHPTEEVQKTLREKEGAIVAKENEAILAALRSCAGEEAGATLAEWQAWLKKRQPARK